jgi:hypothetical protein
MTLPIRDDDSTTYAVSYFVAPFYLVMRWGRTIQAGTLVLPLHSTPPRRPVIGGQSGNLLLGLSLTGFGPESDTSNRSRQQLSAPLRGSNEFADHLE